MLKTGPTALLLLAALLVCTPAQGQQDHPVDRGLPQVASGQVRHVLVKAVGQGGGSEEAERAALKAARALAAARYKALGGASALDTDPTHDRLVAVHHTPPLGFAQIRATVLVEIRLRPLAGAVAPHSAGSEPLPSLTARLESGGVVVEASPAMEAMLVLEQPGGQAPDLLPGGGGGSWRLAPGKPLRQPLPPAQPGSRLHVLACTGGLNAPASAASAAEALLRARAGRPRPAQVQGVVSECVETVLRLSPAAPAPGARAHAAPRSLELPATESAPGD